MLKNYIKIEVDEYGAKRYRNDEGKQHRLDGPALEFKNGSKIWRMNGNNHRNIDPSEEWWDGEKQWWFKGKDHRIGGSFSSVEECWYIQGKEYTKKQYFNKIWKI